MNYNKMEKETYLDHGVYFMAILNTVQLIFEAFIMTGSGLNRVSLKKKPIRKSKSRVKDF